MKIELKPMNKHVVLQDLEEDGKLGEGILFAVGNSSKQYKSAIVLDFAACDEAKGLSKGCHVLYDTVGAVTHTVKGQKFTTVKVLNIIAMIEMASP